MRPMCQGRSIKQGACITALQTVGLVGDPMENSVMFPQKITTRISMKQAYPLLGINTKELTAES